MSNFLLENQKAIAELVKARDTNFLVARDMFTADLESGARMYCTPTQEQRRAWNGMTALERARQAEEYAEAYWAAEQSGNRWLWQDILK